MKTCPICGRAFDDPPRQGRPRIYCSRRCNEGASRGLGRPSQPRKPNRRHVPCRGCGEIRWVSDPSHRPLCRKCRRATASHPCDACGEPTKNRHYCSRKCRPKKSDRTAWVRRSPRVPASERGYGAAWQKLRVKILDRDDWSCQVRGLGCVPDLRMGTRNATVDHIQPLALGGTDDPSNLRACCWTCNSRLGAQLGGRMARDDRPPFPPASQPRPIRPPRQLELRLVIPPTPAVCRLPGCEGMARGRAYCSHVCMREANRRLSRDRYRDRMGIPVDPFQPTSAWPRAGKF